MSQLVVDLGDAPGRAGTRTLVASAHGWRRLHRRHRRVACGQALLGTGLCGQGSIHAGDIPTQFPVMCDSWMSRELLARAWDAGAGPGDSSDDRHRLDGLRDGWQRRERAITTTPANHPLLAVAAGTGDVLMARLTSLARVCHGSAHPAASMIVAVCPRWMYASPSP